MWLGQKNIRTSDPKISSGKLGEIQAKILRSPTNLPAPTPMSDPHIIIPSLRSKPELPEGVYAGDSCFGEIPLTF